MLKSLLKLTARIKLLFAEVVYFHYYYDRSRPIRRAFWCRRMSESSDFASELLVLQRFRMYFGFYNDSSATATYSRVTGGWPGWGLNVCFSTRFTREWYFCISECSLHPQLWLRVYIGPIGASSLALQALHTYVQKIHVSKTVRIWETSPWSNFCPTFGIILFVSLVGFFIFNALKIINWTFIYACIVTINPAVHRGVLCSWPAKHLVHQF